MDLREFTDGKHKSEVRPILGFPGCVDCRVVGRACAMALRNGRGVFAQRKARDFSFGSVGVLITCRGVAVLFPME